MARRNPFVKAACISAFLMLACSAQAQDKIKVGFMLPYTGTYAALGTAIENGFRLYVQEQGGKLGGRELEYFKVDDESEPSKAVDNINKLIKRDNVDVVVGTVHSGRRDGDGEGRQGHEHAADDSQRRCAGGHRSDVRAEHLPQLVLELAARLCDGQGRRRARREEDRDDHVEICGGRRVGPGLQGRHRGVGRTDRQGADAAVSQR